MNQKVTEIIEQIKAKYSGIDTILLFGSATSDLWATDSDIDIFLIDDEFHDSREDIVIDGVQIEIQQDNYNNLAKDIENERGRLKNRNVATMINEAIIITTNSEDKLSQIKSLARDVLNSPSTYTEEDVKMWRYSIEDYLAKAKKDLRRGDPIAFYFDTNYVIQNATELTLATHSVYFPQPKHLASLLQQAAPDFYNIIQAFVTEPILENKLEILQKLHKA